MFEGIAKATLWIGAIGLVWNLLGLSAFINQMLMDTSSLPDLQRHFFDSMPGWAKLAFGTAVIGGTVGCVGLLLGQEWARYVFAVSLLGILVQNYHSFAVSNGLETFGPSGLVMPVLVFGAGLYLLIYSWRLSV